MPTGTVAVMQPAQVPDPVWRRLSAGATVTGMPMPAPTGTAEGMGTEAAGAETILVWPWNQNVLERVIREKLALLPRSNRNIRACSHNIQNEVISRMKLLTEYLERAVSLERLTANEPQSESKKSLLRQACISKV